MNLNALYLLRKENRQFFFPGSEIQLPIDKCYYRGKSACPPAKNPESDKSALQLSIIVTNEKKNWANWTAQQLAVSSKPIKLGLNIKHLPKFGSIGQHCRAVQRIIVCVVSPLPHGWWHNVSAPHSFMSNFNQNLISSTKWLPFWWK